MMLLLPLLIGAIAGGLLGLCAGWLARGRDEVVVENVVTQTVEKFVERTSDAAQSRDQASEIASQLHRLTSGVSARIYAHSRTVHDINDELASASPEGASVVVAAIKRLVDSNTIMQSQLQEAQAQLKEQANLLEAQHAEARTDPLTHLKNRRAFDDELARRLAQPDHGPLSLMMLDVDHFKECNDSYGHLAGDEVLRMVGQILRERAAELPGLFAARYGGEEFALLFSEQTLDEALTLGDQLRRKIELSPVTCERQHITVTASAGIALWQPGEAGSSFISRADEALYAAKRSGRNCSCVYEQGAIRKHAVPPTVARSRTPPAELLSITSESHPALLQAINRGIT